MYKEKLEHNNTHNLTFMQCAECQSPIISNILSTIKGNVVIIHSPLGCASSFVDFNLKFKIGLKKRGLPIENAKLISSNITEMDIQNVIDSIQDNYSIPLITITCKLYNSKAWGSGFNFKKAGGLNKLIRTTHKEGKFYNVINFSSNDDIKEILNKIPVKWNHISCYTDYECLEKMGSAQGTLLISADRFSKYIANWLMERLTEMLTRYDSTFPQRFFTIGKSTYISGITRFLVKELGMIPGCQYIVDDPPYKYRDKIENSFKNITSEISSAITFVNDGEKIIKSIKEKIEDLIPLIIGSSWDSIIASKLKGYFISISLPISDRLILNKSYVGYEGRLAFIEDIFSCILRGL
ncbi:nitrogenase component 1 [Clostridium sp. BJN0013]|uniref:nitrogenase component 1 n=1 Tax=Clostridium sp. BJN0013 TaxID=3236840 RepID=UPI0034C693CD